MSENEMRAQRLRAAEAALADFEQMCTQLAIGLAGYGALPADWDETLAALAQQRAALLAEIARLRAES